jgi:hypothetical protein
MPPVALPTVTASTVPLPVRAPSLSVTAGAIAVLLV